MAARRLRFVIVGGGPAGNQAATTAARLGAEVTLIERDVLGGAANLWDCIPSKTMIAAADGLASTGSKLDLGGLKERIEGVEDRLRSSIIDLLASQGVRIIAGSGRFEGPGQVVVDTADGFETLEADAALIATGSRPRIPDWGPPDGDRILTTRQAYPPPALPEHLVVVGSGVTGVEFVHLFSTLGSQVTLVVSRQQVLPDRDPEVAAALEDDFLRRGVSLLKGARATAIEREAGGVAVLCNDGRVARGSHALLAIGSVPNSENLGLAAAGVDVDERGYVTINHHCQSSVPSIYAAGDVAGKLPLSSVAAMQGRRVAEHVMGLQTLSHRHLDYDKAAQAIFTQPEIAEVGVHEAEAFASGRKIRVTKVPFAANARALISGDARGFVKIVSDPATGVVLGGSIVGGHAAELISVIALAVTAGLRVGDVVDSLLVHPTLSESLADAAE